METVRPRAGLTLVELLVVVVIIALLIIILLPPVVICSPRFTACASNLSQLHRILHLYRVRFGVRPSGTGADLWLSLGRTTPPMVDGPDLFLCPVRGEGEPGTCDYLGPRPALGCLEGGDPLGADLPGNHGPGEGGHVLFADGSVIEVTPGEFVELAPGLAP